MARTSEPGLGPLRLDALEALGLVGHEAHVLAAPALLDRIADRELERHPSLLDIDDPDIDRDLEPERRGGQVVDRDMGAHRVLALVEMLEEELSARVLDVEHHPRRRVHHAFLAHEADAAALVHRDAFRGGEADLERALHGCIVLQPARAWCPAYAILLVEAARTACRICWRPTGPRYRSVGGGGSRRGRASGCISRGRVSRQAASRVGSRRE